MHWKEEESKREKIIALVKSKNGIYNYFELKRDSGLKPEEYLIAINKLNDEDYVSFEPKGDVRLTRKGEKFRSYKRERCKEWYRTMPQKNWLLAEIIKFGVGMVVGAIIGSLIAWLSIVLKLLR